MNVPETPAQPSGISGFVSFSKNYGELSEECITALSNCIRAEHLKKGDCYLKSGVVNPQTGFIVKGIMRHVETDENGNERTSLFLKEDHFASDIESCLRNLPSAVKIEAITDAVVLSLSNEHNRALAARFPEWESVSSLMLIDFLNKIVQTKTFITQHDALSNYRHLITDFPQVLHTVPLGMIASYLGITQQSLSRIRRQI